MRMQSWISRCSLTLLFMIYFYLGFAQPLYAVPSVPNEYVVIAQLNLWYYGPAGLTDKGSLIYPDYDPKGGIVFEADWGGERIWRLAPGETTPTLITDRFGNDNSPCVLPDGRIVTLWMNREGGQGFHEIKVMTPDGNAHYMALTDIDVADIGMGCGG